MYNNLIKFMLTSIVVLTIAIKKTESLASRKKHFKRRMTSYQLYSDSDHITDLTFNMPEIIRNSDKAWLVEFYYSSHGPSHYFKRNWTSLARNIAGWDDVVVVAAVDCEIVKYPALCRDFNPLDLPLVQYFSPGEPMYGRDIQLSRIDTEDKARQEIIKNLIRDQERRRGGTWPNLLPFSGTNSTDVGEEVPDIVKYVLFFFEEETSFLGSEMILDLHKLEYLQVRRVTKDNHSFSSKYGVTKFPSTIVLGRENQVQLNVSIPTIEHVRRIVIRWMETKRFHISEN